MIAQNIIFLLEEILGPSTPVSKDYVFYCPLCKHHKKKLSVNIESGYYHCWVCHLRGRGIKNLILKCKLKNSTKYLQEIEQTIKEFEISRFSLTEIVESQKHTYNVLSLPTNSIPILDSQSLSFRRAHNYLINRGFTDVDIKRYDIRYCNDSNNSLYCDRIIFPSYNINNCINTFNARTIDNLFPKYREPLGVDKHSIIGLENFINWELPVVLVEGLLDCYAVKHNAIPLFGTFIGKLLFEKIVENKPKVYLTLDPEAFEYAIRIAEELFQNNIDVYLTRLPAKQDPSSIGYKQVWDYIKKSKKVDSEFLMKCKLLSRL